MKKQLNQLFGLFPSKLPTGVAEFKDWADSIFYTYDLPDMPSYRQALASMIMHLGPTVDRKPKLFFAKSVKKAQANQIAYEEIQKLKKAEAEYIASTIALENTKLEATDGAANEQPVQE